MSFHATSSEGFAPMAAPITAAPSSLLFIRCVPLPIALQVLRRIRKAYPNTNLTVLANPASVAAITQARVADCVITYSHRRFSLLAAGPGLFLRLWRRGFDRVLVPYLGPSRQPFWNVGRMAAMIAGPKAFWLPCDPPAIGNLETCDRVSLTEWFNQFQSFAGLRRSILQMLKWPLLCLFYLGAMILLSVLAAILVPLVWLKPAEGGASR